MLTLDNDTKRYKNNIALNQISTTFQQGVYGLIGPNGSGKTTLLKILAATENASTGQMYFTENRINRSPQSVRLSLGYLPQQFTINKNVTAQEFLDTTAITKGMIKKKQRQETITSALNEVNLLNKANKRIKHFSMGLKQRLGIAQALINHPQLLIFDEPTVGLDPIERVRFRNLIARLGQRCTVILSTHITGDIVGCCNELKVLYKGQLVFSGPPHALVKKAEGKVWEITDERPPADLKHAFMIEQRDGLFKYKIIADDQPTADSKMIDPSVIDGYLYLTGGGVYV